MTIRGTSNIKKTKRYFVWQLKTKKKRKTELSRASKKLLNHAINEFIYIYIYLKVLSLLVLFLFLFLSFYLPI